MEKATLDDYAVGERIVTPRRTITEHDVVSFAAFTGDWHPLHTDTVYAAESAFGERIAHGMLVLSVAMALPFRLGPHAYLPESFIAFYGMEDVRFTAPVKIGDTLHTECEVESIEAKNPRRGLLTWKNTAINQDAVPCCVYRTRLLCGRRS